MSKKFERKHNQRKQYNFIYIFTEGKKTEPIYFGFKKKEIESEIRRKNIKVEIKGKGFNTISLVDFALDFIIKEKIDLKTDECWVVFDKDDFDKDFDNAINKAIEKNLKVAYSNEAFELWFLLHFIFINSTIARKDYNKKITENFRKLTGNKKYKYDKVESVQLLIEKIKNKESEAIKNAKKTFKTIWGRKFFFEKESIDYSSFAC